MRSAITAFIFFIFIALLAQPAAAGFGYPATDSEGTHGFSSPPYDPTGEVRNNTQHTGSTITLEKIPKIREYSGYGIASANGYYAYLAKNKVIYRMDLREDSPTPSTWLDLTDSISGDKIYNIVAASDGIYITMITYEGEGKSSGVEYFISYDKHITATDLALYTHKDYKTNTAYGIKQSADKVDISIYNNGIAVYTYSVNLHFKNYDVLITAIKSGDKIVFLSEYMIKVYDIRTEKLTKIAEHGSNTAAGTLAIYTSAVVANNRIYAVLAGDYFTNTSVVEIYTLDGGIIAKYPVPKIHDIYYSEQYNAFILGGKGIYVYYGDSFTAPAYYNEGIGISALIDNEYKPVAYYFGISVYTYDFRNYTPAGTFISPPTDTEGRIITGVYFQPAYTLEENTNISFYVSNDAGATWYKVNTTNGNISFTNASEGDSVFYWRADLAGDEYHTPIIEHVNFILYTEDPVKITDMELGGYLHSNRSAYYVGDPVDFTVDIEDRDNERSGWLWAWNFGDPYANSTNPNNATSAFNATHIYTRPNVYTITVNVSDIDGHNDSMNTTVIIADRPPEARIWATSPYGANDQFISIAVGDTIKFNASNSTDPDMPYNPDEKITAYSWDTLGATTKITNYTFSAAGVYNVILTVQDNYTLSHSSAITVYVDSGNLPPQPYIKAPSEAMINTAVSFSSAGTIDPNGDALSYLWDFGDGTNSTAANPTHVYTDYGTYTVNLTVSDGEYNISYYHVITIKPYPPAGDWIISDHITVENWKITIRGNIYIQSGGWLELKNTTLYIDTPSDGYLTIDVKEGGKLTANHSDIITPYTKYGEDLKYRYHYYNFLVGGAVVLIDTTVRNTWLDKPKVIDGITVGATGEFSAINSVLIWSAGNSISRHLLLAATSPAIEISNTLISMNLGGAGAFYNTNNIAISDCEIKNLKGGFNLFSTTNTTFSGNTIKRIPNAGFLLTDSPAIIDNCTIDSVGEGITVKSGTATIKYNTIYGAGNNTIGLNLFTATPAYSTTVKYAGIGILAHITTNIYDCVIKRNTIDYSTGGVIHVWYSVRFYLTYLNNPVIGYVLIKNGDSTLKNMSSGANGYTNWTYIEMERIGSNSTAYYTITAEAHYKDYLIQEVIAHVPHNEILINFAPTIEGGGVGAEEAGAINWLYVLGGLLLIWAVLLLAWKYKFIRASLATLISIAIATSAAFLTYVGVISSITAIVIVGITIIAILWFTISNRIVRYIGIGITAAVMLYNIYNAGWINIAVDIPALAGFAIGAIGVVAYRIKGIGKGREYAYIPAVLLASVGVYGWLAGSMVYFYIGIIITIMAVVGWYSLTTGARISIGAAVLVLALIAIISLVIAYILGVWYPFMLVNQLLSAVNSNNPVNPNNWNIPNPFKGVL